jgi:hypothetical protein
MATTAESPRDSTRQALGVQATCVGWGVLVGDSWPGSWKMKLPETLGFRLGTASVHTSRTMMVSELSLILEHVGVGARAEEYRDAVIHDNILGKPTQATRMRTAQRLVELYSLDPNRATFRLLRHFWEAAGPSRPLLACLAATARDPLLRETAPFILAIPIGEGVNASQVADLLEEKFPSRFKPTTRLSTAQNLASSWTQAGYLAGKLNKKRSRPMVTAVTAAYALVLGYLCGMRGKMLLDNRWTRMLDRTPAQVADLVAEASRQGWLTYKGAGSVVEIGFPGLLSPQEEKASHDPD